MRGPAFSPGTTSAWWRDSCKHWSTSGPLHPRRQAELRGARDRWPHKPFPFSASTTTLNDLWGAIMFNLSQLAGRLTCPDDESILRSGKSIFACDSCGRVFPVHRSRLLDLLPSAPLDPANHMSSSYSRAYEQEFRRLLRLDRHGLPWGAPVAQPAPWLHRRQRQVAAVLPLLSCGRDTSKLLLCD